MNFVIVYLSTAHWLEKVTATDVRDRIGKDCRDIQHIKCWKLVHEHFQLRCHRWCLTLSPWSFWLLLRQVFFSLSCFTTLLIHCPATAQTTFSLFPQISIPPLTAQCLKFFNFLELYSLSQTSHNIVYFLTISIFSPLFYLCRWSRLMLFLSSLVCLHMIFLIFHSDIRIITVQTANITAHTEAKKCFNKHKRNCFGATAKKEAKKRKKKFHLNVSSERNIRKERWQIENEGEQRWKIE